MRTRGNTLWWFWGPEATHPEREHRQTVIVPSIATHILTHSLRFLRLTRNAGRAFPRLSCPQDRRRRPRHTRLRVTVQQHLGRRPEVLNLLVDEEVDRRALVRRRGQGLG